MIFTFLFESAKWNADNESMERKKIKKKNFAVVEKLLIRIEAFERRAHT